MSLFVQNIALGMSNADNIVEKVTLPLLTKRRVDLTVAPGVIALIGSVKYKGREIPYKLTRDVLGSKQMGVEVYLWQDKPFDNIKVTFFGGQYSLSLHSLPGAKGRFALVGEATLEIADFKDLAKFVGRSITRTELSELLNKEIREHLHNEVSNQASKLVTENTTDVSFRASLDTIAQEVIRSRKVTSTLMNMGLLLSSKGGLSMHLNALEDAQAKQQVIDDALTTKALEALDNDIRDREERERDKERQFEIDRIRAEHTNVNETVETRNINTTGNGKVVFNQNTSESKKPRYCPICGNQIGPDANFCASCGKKL